MSFDLSSFAVFFSLTTLPTNLLRKVFTLIAHHRAWPTLVKLILQFYSDIFQESKESQPLRNNEEFGASRFLFPANDRCR